MAKPIIYHEYNRPEGKHVTEVYEYSKDGKILNPSLTKQEMATDCDINNIMAKWVKTGQPPLVNPNFLSGDVSNAETYHDAMNFVAHVNSEFENLPARFRSKFDNNPEKFLEFVGNPKNQQELIDMGLAKDNRPPKAPDTVPAPKTDPVKGTPEAGNKPEAR